MRQHIQEKETTRGLIKELERYFLPKDVHIHPSQLFVQEVIQRPDGETSTALLLNKGKEACSVTMTRHVNAFTYSEPTFLFSDQDAFNAWKESLLSAKPSCNPTFIRKSIPYLLDFSQEHAALRLSLYCYKKPGKIHPADVTRMELRIRYDPSFSMSARYRLRISPAMASYFSLALKNEQEVVITNLDNGIASMYSRTHCPPRILAL